MTTEISRTNIQTASNGKKYLEFDAGSAPAVGSNLFYVSKKYGQVNFIVDGLGAEFDCKILGKSRVRAYLSTIDQ